jgi:ABC-type dipeptide/oligopeptide/nickel transport system permease component
VVVLGALLYQFVNLATDLLYAALDPRVRLVAPGA